MYEDEVSFFSVLINKHVLNLNGHFISTTKSSFTSPSGGAPITPDKIFHTNLFSFREYFQPSLNHRFHAWFPTELLGRYKAVSLAQAIGSTDHRFPVVIKRRQQNNSRLQFNWRWNQLVEMFGLITTAPIRQDGCKCYNLIQRENWRSSWFEFTCNHNWFRYPSWI